MAVFQDNDIPNNTWNWLFLKFWGFPRFFRGVIWSAEWLEFSFPIKLSHITENGQILGPLNKLQGVGADMSESKNAQEKDE